MRILVLRNIGRKTLDALPKGTPAYSEGQVVECDDATATALIESKLAERADSVRAVTPVREKLKGVTPEK